MGVGKGRDGTGREGKGRDVFRGICENKDGERRAREGSGD